MVLGEWVSCLGFVFCSDCLGWEIWRETLNNAVLRWLAGWKGVFRTFVVSPGNGHCSAAGQKRVEEDQRQDTQHTREISHHIRSSPKGRLFRAASDFRSLPYAVLPTQNQTVSGAMFVFHRHRHPRNQKGNLARVGETEERAARYKYTGQCCLCFCFLLRSADVAWEIIMFASESVILIGEVFPTRQPLQQPCCVPKPPPVSPLRHVLLHPYYTKSSISPGQAPTVRDMHVGSTTEPCTERRKHDSPIAANCQSIKLHRHQPNPQACAPRAV